MQRIQVSGGMPPLGTEVTGSSDVFGLTHVTWVQSCIGVAGQAEKEWSERAAQSQTPRALRSELCSAESPAASALKANR